ncbi:hypothetical protein TEA_025898 [Camellia sinensis var. sinensis]|uniref:Protein kinase domain-containing protein n=1 Tax=Camellia sinensis var. sinensis TaxID=542762 RepID=A0A4S4DEK1_CAMSN|nr:hypothetical protein TEA_025898 [Camellia sinensis var. sinensis]
MDILLQYVDGILATLASITALSFEHIDNQIKASNISWENCLQIAAKTTRVLSYFHSTASIPIIYRDVKSTNILLDDNYTAKVSNFGTSRLVPLDQDLLVAVLILLTKKEMGGLSNFGIPYQADFARQEKEVGGLSNFGIPCQADFSRQELILLTKKEVCGLSNFRIPCRVDFARQERNPSQARQFRGEDVGESGTSGLGQFRCGFVRSDVYSFGVVLVELIIGKKVLSFDRPEEERSLVKGEQRLTMKEVAMELKGLIIKKMMKHSCVEIDLNCEDTEYLPGERSSAYELGGCTTSSINTTSPTRYDSVREHIRLPFDGGR